MHIKRAMVVNRHMTHRGLPHRVEQPQPAHDAHNAVAWKAARRNESPPIAGRLSHWTDASHRLVTHAATA